MASAVALSGATALGGIVVFDQSTYEVDADFRNSNTPTNGNPVTNTGSTQQIADDFTLAAPGLEITQVNLWFVYQFGTPTPLMQPLVVRFWDDAGGVPGSILYEETVNILPVSTGDFNSFFDELTGQMQSREIFSTEVVLPTSFFPDAGIRYWLSPLGDDDDVTWGWQFADPDGGERASRFGNAVTPDWRSFSGDLAFSLIVPEPSAVLMLAMTGLGFGLRRSRR